MSARPVVIVGANAAGLGAARGLREAGYEGEVRLLDRDRDALAQRPAFSKEMLLDDAAAPPALLAPAQIENLRLSVELGVEVAGLDPHAMSLRVAGRDLAAEAIILCTGATPRLPADLAAGPRTHVLRTRADAERLRTVFRGGGRLAVLGGGLIGLEAAAAARRAGLEVTVLEAAPSVLGRVLPDELAALVAEEHRRQGVRLVTSARLHEVRTSPDAVRLALAGGLVVEVDHLLVAVGAAPATALAQAAGLAVADGIVVDAWGRTSAARVWAAGDVARFPGPEATRRWETLQHAELHGRHVGAAAAGSRRPYQGLNWFWSDQYALNLQALGRREGPPDIRRSTPEGGVLALWTTGRRLAGAAGLNAGRAMAAAKRLAAHGGDLEPEALATEDLAQLARRTAA